MGQANHSILHILALYFSPLALPHQTPQQHATWPERQRIHRLNMLKIRPFLRSYIFRSGQLILAMFIATFLFSVILPLPLLAVTASIGIILAVIHTAFLIFMQQSANNIASRQGLKNSEIEQDENSHL